MTFNTVMWIMLVALSSQLGLDIVKHAPTWKIVLDVILGLALIGVAIFKRRQVS